MPTLHDLSKEQLIELLDLSLFANKKQIQVLQLLVAQIKQRPKQPRITIDLPIKELSPKDAEFEIRLEKTKLANVESPFELYKYFKDSLMSDINIYTI